MQTVLIVEDEKMIRRGICAMVQRSGVPVETIMECSNGQMALEILKSQRVDVMITDIRMPKMDGIELVQRMQELPHIPLTIAVSGYDDFTYAVEMMRNGVREYLLKPVDRDSLAGILKKLEQELQAQQEQELRKRMIACGQLRQILETGEIRETERQLAEGSAGTKILHSSYAVCVLEEHPAQEERDAWLYLGKTGDGCAYLVEQSGVSFLLRNELKDSCVGVSRPHEGIDELHAAYLEALWARKRAFCRGVHSCCSGEDCGNGQGQAENAALLPSDDEIRKLAQLLGTDRFRDAIYYTGRFFQQVQRGAYSPVQMEHYIEILLHSIRTTYETALEEEKEKLGGLQNPYGFASLQRYGEELAKWQEAFHGKLEARLEDGRSREKLEQAIAYIRENYSRDLNMAVVSNYVSMNYSLFSQRFKQYTGKNFVAYLKELRMEEARSLLAGTQLRVGEISQRVGYENEKHFMKTFKSTFGVSPSEYRKNTELR